MCLRVETSNQIPTSKVTNTVVNKETKKKNNKLKKKNKQRLDASLIPIFWQ